MIFGFVVYGVSQVSGEIVSSSSSKFFNYMIRICICKWRIAVMSTKFKVEVFNGKGDFLLWRKKLKVVLIHMKVAKAINKTYPNDLGEDKQLEMDKIALCTIILHLFDSVLRKVDDMKTTEAMWARLEELYLVIFEYV